MATRLKFTIKVYNTGGLKSPWRVKIEAPGDTPDDVWQHGEGKGVTQSEAYAQAVAGMKKRPALVAASVV